MQAVSNQLIREGLLQSFAKVLPAGCSDANWYVPAFLGEGPVPAAAADVNLSGFPFRVIDESDPIFARVCEEQCRQMNEDYAAYRAKANETMRLYPITKEELVQSWEES